MVGGCFGWVPSAAHFSEGHYRFVHHLEEHFVDSLGARTLEVSLKVVRVDYSLSDLLGGHSLHFSVVGFLKDQSEDRFYQESYVVLVFLHPVSL